MILGSVVVFFAVMSESETVVRGTNVRCSTCRHIQWVPVDKTAFACERCDAQLTRALRPNAQPHLRHGRGGRVADAVRRGRARRPRRWARSRCGGGTRSSRQPCSATIEHPPRSRPGIENPGRAANRGPAGLRRIAPRTLSFSPRRLGTWHARPLQSARLTRRLTTGRVKDASMKSRGRRRGV